MGADISKKSGCRASRATSCHWEPNAIFGERGLVGEWHYPEMIRALLPSFAGLPRGYWYVWTGAFINRVGGFVLTFLAFYLTHERKLSVEQTGMIVSLYGAGGLLAAGAGGFLADRLGRRATMMLSMCLSSAAMLHLAIARSAWHIAVATLILGSAADLYRPAMAAMVADAVPPPDRPRAYGLLYWAANMGFSIAAVIAGLMAKRSFWPLFVGDALTSLVFAAILWLRVPETLPEKELPGDQQLRPGPMLPFQDGLFMAFVCLGFGIASVFHQFLVTLPVDMNIHGISAEQYGSLIALNGLLIVLLQPTATRIVARFPPTHVLAAGALLAGAGFGATQLASSIPAYAATIVVWTLGEIICVPVSPAVVAGLAPKEIRGGYQGVYQMSWGAAGLTAPLIGSAIMGRHGAAALWTGCFAVGLAVALGYFMLARATRRRLASIQPSAPAANGTPAARRVLQSGKESKHRLVWQVPSVCR